MTLHIPAFRGLNQYGDGTSVDPRFAVDCANALTVQGALRPMSKCQQLPGELPHPIETLAMLHRRWHAAQKDVLIAASGGQLYWMLPEGGRWTKMSMPYGWSETEYQLSTWSCVSYEINPEGSDAPVDVLLMSNPRDGMICVRGDTMEVSPVATPGRFGVIARHAERIWGGAMPDDPDKLAYSAPYDPFNWAADPDYPEDGAGDILQPSWDGDSFTALHALGSQLIALKKHRVWRIIGTNPGEYVFSEQFGGGAEAAATVAVDGTGLFMLGESGVMRYDGESAAPFEQSRVRHVLSRLNRKAADQACACVHRGRYYLALALDESPVNNAVLRYDTQEDTWLLRTDVQVESFLPAGENLYFTSASTPGRVWQWLENEPDGVACAMRWVSPWLTLNKPSVKKGEIAVYLTVNSPRPACVTVGLENEKRIKKKTVCFQGTRRVRFAGFGRRVRLTLESAEGAPFVLEGGAEVVIETDED